MRVLVFLPCFTHGGAEKQGAILARHLTQKGHDVEVWGFPTLGSSTPLLEELKQDGIRCLELPEWPKFNWDFTRHGRYIRYIEKRFFEWPIQVKKFEKTIPLASFDVVVPFTPMPCIVSVLFANRIHFERIIWNHRGGYTDSGFRYTNFLVEKIKSKKPLMVSNSTAGAQFLADTFSLPLDQVTVIRNVFLPDDLFSPLAADREYNYRADTPLQLLHVANLFPEKDIWTVLAAIKHLKNSGFLCHLHIAGFFSSLKDSKTFEEKIISDDLNDMVTYHGAVGRQQLRGLLGKADIGLLSSHSEGLPNSVMEYMYAGLPVIGTFIPGIREVLGENSDDWLFPCGNAEQLAHLIVMLGTDPSTRKMLGKANNNRIREDFTSENLLPKWEKIFECCMA